MKKLLVASLLCLSYSKAHAGTLKTIEDALAYNVAGSSAAVAPLEITAAPVTVSLAGTGADWMIGVYGTSAQTATFNFAAGGVSLSTVTLHGGQTPWNLVGQYKFLAKSPSITVTSLTSGATAVVLLQGGKGLP